MQCVQQAPVLYQQYVFHMLSKKAHNACQLPGCSSHDFSCCCSPLGPCFAHQLRRGGEATSESSTGTILSLGADTKCGFYSQMRDVLFILLQMLTVKFGSATAHRKHFIHCQIQQAAPIFRLKPIRVPLENENLSLVADQEEVPRKRNSKRLLVSWLKKVTKKSNPLGSRQMPFHFFILLHHFLLHHLGLAFAIAHQMRLRGKLTIPSVRCFQ